VTNDYKKILNIASGKILPLDCNTSRVFILNVDSVYKSTTTLSDVEEQFKSFDQSTACYSAGYKLKSNSDAKSISQDPVYLNYNIYEFLEEFPYKFDGISVYRFLEHVKRTDVLYFIYLMASSLNEGGILDIIVPNYIELASRLLADEEKKRYNEAEDILLTSEFVNEPECPHASMWTPKRAKYFLELEGRFKIEKLIPKFKFDGRDIYMRIICKRTNG